MKKVLAITMAIMIAAIVIMPALGYTGETAGNRSFSITSAGNQSYSASSAGGQSYTVSSAGNVSSTAASAGRADYSISTGVAAHNLTPNMVTGINSVNTTSVKGMRIPYSIKYGSGSNFSIQLGSIVPYSIKQGSIVPYSIKQGSVGLHSVKLMEVNNTLRDTYQKVKLEPRKLGSIAGRETVVSEPVVVEKQPPAVQEVTTNETSALNETVTINETAVVEEAAVNETVTINETAVVEEAAVNETVTTNETTGLNETFVFSWTKVPGTDDDRLKEYLGKRYNIDWIYRAGIVKSEDGKTIDISQEDSILSLALNDDESEVLLKIDNITTDKFIAKMENGNLNIYNETATVNETASATEAAPVEANMTEVAAGAAVTATAATSEPASVEVVAEAVPVEFETVEIAPVEAAAEVAPAKVEVAAAEAVTEAAPETAATESATAEAVAAEAAPVAAAAEVPATGAAATGKAGRGYTIEGVVFEDLNGNGVKNVVEDGLANWTVNLEQPEGVVIKTVNSAADGKFVFLNQLPGTYTIKEVLQAGWTLVAPAEGKLTVEVVNESVTHLGFANKLA